MPSNDRVVPANAAATEAPRREFLKIASLLAGAAGLQVAPGLLREAHAAENRQYAAGRTWLELEGQAVDYLKSVEGGYPRGDVVSMPMANDPRLLQKRVGAVSYSDIEMQIPISAAPVVRWMVSSLDGNQAGKGGAIVAGDHNGVEQSRLAFSNALLAEFTIPACDGASRDAGLFTVKLRPERTQVSAGKGSGVPAPAMRKDLPAWHVANFRLKIDRLEAECAFVSKIEPVSIRQLVSAGSVGQDRYQQNAPARIEMSNLVFYVAENRAGAFYKWFDEFVIQGNNGDGMERKASLELLSPSLRDVLLRVNFSGVGIIGCRPEMRQGGIPLVRVEMYFERIGIETTTVAAATGTPAKRDAPVGGSGSVGTDVLRRFNQ